MVILVAAGPARFHTRLLLLVCALLVAAVPIQAAGQAPPVGAIAGTVVGPDAARLPGVTVTVHSGAQVVARVVSGDQGVYLVSGLPLGAYEVQAELPGFHAAITTIEVIGGPPIRLDLALKVEGLKESITVFGSKPADTLESPRIKESGARDVGEAIGAMAGLWKVRRGAVANDVVLRGYQGENVTVLIDGVRLYGACPNNMDHAAFHVDFAEVDRIEVGKGPFDLKNQGALGGVVNIVTKRPANGTHVTPQVSFGSAGYLNPSLTASYGSGRFAVLGGYSYRRSGAYEDGSGRSFLNRANYRASALEKDVFDVQTGWARVDVAASDRDRMLVTYTAQRAGVILYPYLQMDALWDDADRVKLGWDSNRPMGPMQVMRAEAYATRVRHWMTDQYRMSSSTASLEYSMATMAETETAGVRGEAVFSGLTAGVEAHRRRWSAKTTLAMGGYQPQYSIPDVDIDSLGLFGQYSRALTSTMGLEVGGRIDYTSSQADAAKANVLLYRAYQGSTSTSSSDVYPSAKARLSWQAMPTVTLSGGVGRTVRVPDPQERYFGLRRSGTDWVGNPALRPVSNTGFDLVLAVRPQRLSLNATIHYDLLDDFINVYQQPRLAVVPGVTNAKARSYRNVDARMSGGDVSGVLALTDRLFVAGDVSAVRGRQLPSADRGILAGGLPEIPPLRSRAAVRYEHRAERTGMFVEVEAVYSAGQTIVASELGETPTAGYGVANVRAGANARKLRLTVGVGNVFDRTYFEHLSYQRDPFRSGVKVYEPGRNVYTTVSVAF